MISTFLKELALEDDLREEKPLPSFSVQHPDIIHFSVAHIADDLGPLIRDHVRPTSKISVIGYDGTYVIAPEKDKWRLLLSHWLLMGCEVRYFLQEMDQEKRVYSQLKDLSKLAEKSGGKFSVFVLKKDVECSPALKRSIRDWKTFHFVVFENPAQLWIESSHLPLETEAHDCYYFPPNVAQDSALPKIYGERFNHVVNEACEQVI